MTDLQIGLLLIGAAAVVGVLVYNRVQERASRRQAERAFGSKHADVLLEPASDRREPTLEPLARTPPAPAASPASRGPRVDYVIALVGGSATRSAWAPLERRFGARAMLSEEGAALQMVNRSGVVSEAEVLEFRSEVESFAAAHGASVSAPPVREALEEAQALDRACADVDVQIALHVLGPVEAELGDQPFAVTRRADGVTLLLDVPRTPRLVESYAAMASAARRLNGRVVDDNGNALDERALAAIGIDVEALRGRLAQLGIEPGSPLALRLFS
jgi:hypothetical protein